MQDTTFRIPVVRLTVTDLAPSIATETAYLFDTREAALAYAAKRGTMGGYLEYRLNGKLV